MFILKKYINFGYKQTNQKISDLIKNLIVDYTLEKNSKSARHINGAFLSLIFFPPVSSLVLNSDTLVLASLRQGV